MDNLPKRDDPIYKEIESFEKYELTPCIAYEMAIRNEKVKKILDQIARAPLHDDKMIQVLMDNWDNDPKLQKMPKPGLIPFNKEKDKLINELKNNYFVDYYNDRPLEQEQVMKKILNRQLTNFPIHEKTGNGFIIEQGINSESTDFDFSTIKTFFKRSLYDANQTSVILNLHLPKEELIAYINQIKNTYDNDESIIKSPLELLGEILHFESIDFKNMTAEEWADCFFIYDYFKTSPDTNVQTRYEKIQKLLTEYNGFKIEKYNLEIKESRKHGDNSKYKIVSYSAYQINKEIYRNKVVKDFYSEKTIRERFKLMFSLIDNLKYQTLISK